MRGRKLLIILIAVNMAIALGSCQDEQTREGIGAGEQTAGAEEVTADIQQARGFLREAAQSNRMESEISQLAMDHAASERVKELASKLIREHNQLDERLQAIAEHKGVRVPDRLSPDHLRIIDRLAGLHGADFDMEYLRVMEDSHSSMVDLYEEAADEIRDPDIQTFAARHLPTLKAHHALLDHRLDMEKDSRRRRNRAR